MSRLYRDADTACPTQSADQCTLLPFHAAPQALQPVQAVGAPLRCGDDRLAPPEARAQLTL